MIVDAPRATGRFSDQRQRPRWWVIALVVAGHLLAFYGLLRAFAPAAVISVERTVLSTFSVTVKTPPPPPPPPPAAEPKPDEGAAGDPGKKAVPRPVAAPTPRITTRPSSMPKAPSTGSANSAGARDVGDGTGAAGNGVGTGSGRGGAGQGGIATTKAVKISGDINSASDFPVPAGGRQVRFGTSVTVYMTVTPEGRATGCRVVKPSPDPEADAIVCRLAEQRFRFRPATDSDGNPVTATYGWRQEWFAR